MKMKVAHNAKAEPHKLKFAIEYEGDKATAYTVAEEVVIQIAQPVRLEFDEPQIPKEVLMPVIMGEEDQEEDETPKNQRQWWISIILAAGIIIVIAGARFYFKKKQERIRRQEDEEWEDDSES